MFFYWLNYVWRNYVFFNELFDQVDRGQIPMEANLHIGNDEHHEHIGTDDQMQGCEEMHLRWIGGNFADECILFELYN